MLLVLPRAAWVLALSSLAIVPARAQQDQADSLASKSAGNSGEAGSGSLSTQIGYYHHDDDLESGNPFLDEELTVIEPLFIWDKNVSDDWGYSVTVSYDSVTSASIDRLSKFPEQSGASGDYYASVDYASRHRRDEGEWLGWLLGASIEYDYMSLHLGGNYSQESDDKNVTNSYALTGFFDTVDIIRFDGSGAEGSDTRLSLAASYNRTAVLSPTWIGDLGVTLAAQSGFLETAYNAVVLEDAGLPPNPNLYNQANGIEVAEELPDTRLRAALSYRARHFLSPGRAVELGGRLYGDDWGIFSFALEPRYYMPLIADRLSLRLRYRYYNQTAADDFQEEFQGTTLADAPEFRTQDSDLGDLDSHTIGSRFDLTPGGDHNWYFDLNYVTRSDGLDHYYLGVGYSFAF